MPIFSFGVPDIASAEIDATFGLHASLDYHVGFGIDSHGVYLDAGTPSDPTLGLSFGVDAGLQGQVEVFGFPLASVGGDVGFAIEPYVTLTAPPWAADPAKVYVSDLALFGSNPVSDLLDDLGAGIQGDLTGNVYASIDLFLFSISWNWGVSIPVFNYERVPTWPAEAGGGGQTAQWSNVHQNGGVLTFTGTGGNNNIGLSSGSGGAVTINWTGSGNTSGHTSETFDGITELIYNGGSGNDTLAAARASTSRRGPSPAAAMIPSSSRGRRRMTPWWAAAAATRSRPARARTSWWRARAAIPSWAGRAAAPSTRSMAARAATRLSPAAARSRSTGGSGRDTITAGAGSTGTYFIDGGSGSYTASIPRSSTCPATRAQAIRSTAAAAATT